MLRCPQTDATRMNKMEPNTGEPAPELEAAKIQQELRNLKLEEKKLGLELADLQRPYVFRNSQLFTAVVATVAALITAAGAMAGAYVLIKQNYFQALRARSDWLVDIANNRQEEAHKLSREADRQVAASKLLIDQANDAVQAAETRTKYYEATAKTQGALAAEASRKAQLAQRKWFQSLHLPEWLIGQLAHVSRFSTDNRLGNFAWL